MQDKLIKIIKQLVFIAESALLARHAKDLDRFIDWDTVSKLLMSIKDEIKEIEDNKL